MESLRIKEALQTALMLSKVATSKHKVEIAELGEVYIAKNFAAFVDEAGEYQRITTENVEARLGELVEDSHEDNIRQRLQEMVFA